MNKCKSVPALWSDPLFGIKCSDYKEEFKPQLTIGFLQLSSRCKNRRYRKTWNFLITITILVISSSPIADSCMHVAVPHGSIPSTVKTIYCFFLFGSMVINDSNVLQSSYTTRHNILHLVHTSTPHIRTDFPFLKGWSHNFGFIHDFKKIY